MDQDALKQRLISHGATPAWRAGAALRLIETASQAEQTALMTKCFEAAMDETLSAVSHVLDELLTKCVHEASGSQFWHEVDALAKALRGEGEG